MSYRLYYAEASHLSIPKFISNPDPNIYFSDNYCVLDFETTNNNKGDAVDENNRIIYGYVWSSLRGSFSITSGFQLKELEDILYNTDFIVAHNAKFEAKWLLRSGIKTERLLFYDTCLGEYCIAGNRKLALDLSSSCARYGIGEKENVVSGLIYNEVCPSTIPFSLLNDYCRRDVEITKELFLKQRDKIFKDGLEKAVYTRNILVPMLAEIEMSGMFLDEEVVNKLYKENTERHQIINKTLGEITGGINMASPSQVAKFLYGDLGFKELTDRRGNPIRNKPSKQFPEGLPCTDEPTILLLKAKSKKQERFLKLKVEESHLRKTITSYLENFLDSCTNHGCLLHGKLNQIITGTHRLSSSNPNLQNIDRKLKKVITARKKGWKIRSADYCIAPSTRILTTNLEWKQAKDIIEGDKLIGFPEEGTLRECKLRPTIVEKVKKIIKPCVKITTDRGNVVCSTDHFWKARKRKPNGNSKKDTNNLHKADWISANALKIGDSICGYVDPWEEIKEYDAGWFSGFLDGEGWVAGTKVMWGQKPFGHNLLVLDKANAIANKYGFTTLTKDQLTSSACRVYPVGEQTGLKILGMFRPVRLLAKAEKLWRNKRPFGKWSKGRNILSIEYIGEQEVIAIQTDAHTFIAEGMLSHNCQLEFRVAAWLAQDQQALQDILDDVDVHTVTKETITNAGQEITRQEAKAHTFKPLYGGSSGTEAEKAYYDAFKSKYPEITATQNEWVDEVLSTGKLRTVTGLLFYFTGTEYTQSGYVINSTAIKNYPVQMFATADIAPMGALLLWHSLKSMNLKSFIINLVHDSVIMEEYEKEDEILGNLIDRCLSKDVIGFYKKLLGIDLNYPLDVDQKKTTNWDWDKING